MIRAKLTRLFLTAALTSFLLTFVASVVTRATQTPAGSEGWRLPEGAATEPNPVPITPAVLAKGQSLYKAKCQRCHGGDATGHGPESDPNHPAGDLTDARRASRNPDGVMFYKIWSGRTKPKMPAMKADISRTDVWTLIHYVKTLRNG
jgi:mono/diheme cytochrome c family protein